MSGMGSTLQLNNPTVVAAFRSALIHQGIIALLLFFLLAMIWVSVREWVPGPRTSFRPTAGELAAEPRVGALGVAIIGVIPLATASASAGASPILAQALDGSNAQLDFRAPAFTPGLPAKASSAPEGGATLAAAPGGGFEALSARGGQLSVWSLSPGGSGWNRSQVINVAIPYGSSG